MGGVSIGIPTNVRGIYTTDEDDILLGGNSKMIDEVEKKHGICNDRIEWLQNYRAA